MRSVSDRAIMYTQAPKALLFHGLDRWIIGWLGEKTGGWIKGETGE